MYIILFINIINSNNIVHLYFKLSNNSFELSLSEQMYIFEWKERMAFNV
jgi:hypothetical protein